MCDLCATAEHWSDVIDQPEHWAGDIGDVIVSDPRGHITTTIQGVAAAAMNTIADMLGIADRTDMTDIVTTATASFMADFGHPERHATDGTVTFPRRRIHTPGHCPDSAYGTDCDGWATYTINPYFEDIQGRTVREWLCSGLHAGLCADADQPDTRPVGRWACDGNLQGAEHLYHCVLPDKHDGPHQAINGWTFWITEGRHQR